MNLPPNLPMLITNGLKALFTMDDRDIAGTTVHDRIGGVDATLVNGPTTGHAAPRGQSVYFDGANDFMRATAPAPLQLGGTGLTLAAWINVPAYAGPNTAFHGIMGCTNGGGGSPYAYWMIRLGSGSAEDVLDFAFWNGSGFPEIAGATHLATNTWYHIAGTYDGAYMRLYVDGSLDRAQAETSSIVTSTDRNFVVGYENDTDRMFKGYIHDVRVYNRGLSADEIYALAKLKG